ncbi:hypothetical protein L1987_42577 [Smallanthus sonchifolius]|uniref:Uncharacterized protein n=1 Tax=Smallanthus sonchifolius TaxID=185202 RepID=A0ACB9GJZ8_9ASTR|nr:hypothetical protein L1987_42577 [Smallanthus sonchifolius]
MHFTDLLSQDSQFYLLKERIRNTLNPGKKYLDERPSPLLPLTSQFPFSHHPDAFSSTPYLPPPHLPLRRACRPLTIPYLTIISGTVHVRSMDNNHQTTLSSRHHGGSGGGREDCWTESETETLIESWGDRYLQLNRGNLRQKDWKDVANAVNANRDRLKLPRTDVQCKNRIDTLKKKYKLEKSKLTPSKWPFFHRLDDLIGAVNSVTRKKVSAPKSASVTLTAKSNSKPNPNPNLKVIAYSGGSSSHEESVDCGDGTTAYKELARAIVRFGEVYERMENSKQEEMLKLEKQRMEFTREVEFQRLNMFMETQVELEKMKRKKKRTSATDSLSPGKKP